MAEYDNRYHFHKTYVEEPRELGSMSLYQLGRMHCHGATVVYDHLHRMKDWYEITVVTDGAGTVSTNQIPTRLTKGQIYLSFHGDLHRIESDPEDPLKYDFCCFCAKDGDMAEELAKLSRTCLGVEHRVVTDERIEALVGNAIAEIGADEPFADAILESILRQVAWYLIRDYSARSAERHRASESPTELCYQMMHYIDTHLYTMKSLAELSDALRYHYSYLSSQFHLTTGETLQDYYRDRRMEAARLLLSEGNLSVGEIAEALHYSSIYTFSRAFKDRYGIPPTAVRRVK